MFTPRRSQRYRIRRTARLELESAGGEAGSILARTLDLSRHGIAILSPTGVAPGDRLRVVVEERRGAHSRLWRWRGRVVDVRIEPDGHRLGIEFSTPEAGPWVAIRCPRAGVRPALIRVDPAWTPPPEGDTAEWPVAAREPTRTAGPIPPALRLCATAALIGLLADQLTKAFAFAPPGGRTGLREIVPGILTGIRVRDGGTPGGPGTDPYWVNTAWALLALGMTGLLVRRAIRDGHRWGCARALGWGCLLAGLLGNVADRLALGYVRGFLHATPWPTWTFNLADLLALFGVLVLLGSSALGKARRPTRASRPQPVLAESRGG